jgi:hypothetical protein
MSKRFIGATLVALLITAVLSACSITDHKNLSGNAARDAAVAVVANSVKKFEAEGGTETLSVSDKEFVLIYDPSAPEGKQVVTSNLADKTTPTFDDAKSISITALKKLLGSDTLKDAEFKLSDNIFKITGNNFTIELHTKDDLVMTSVISGKATGINVPQIVVSSYGLSKEAKKLFESAVEPAPAQ